MKVVAGYVTRHNINLYLLSSADVSGFSVNVPILHLEDQYV